MHLHRHACMHALTGTISTIASREREGFTCDRAATATCILPFTKLRGCAQRLLRVRVHENRVRKAVTVGHRPRRLRRIARHRRCSAVYICVHLSNTHTHAIVDRPVYHMCGPPMPAFIHQWSCSCHHQCDHPRVRPSSTVALSGGRPFYLSHRPALSVLSFISIAHS